MGILARLIAKQTAPSKKAANDSNYASSKFRGVQVTANSDTCCRAARDIANQRFLSDEVPMLPLNRCNLNICQCTYKLFDDRRTDVRRASDTCFDIATQLSEDNNRNSDIPGRRIDD